MAAVEARDLSVLMATVADLDGFVAVNRERKALQLWDCQRTAVIATLTLRERDFATLEALLDTDYP